MNKVIAILILLLTALPSFCQRRNAKGQKVVEKVTVQMKGETSPFITINFSYDRNLSMNGIIFKSNFDKIVWKKQGNTITRTLYDEKGNVDKNYHYSYVIRDDGMIGQLKSDNVGIDGSILRYRYYFIYDCENKLDYILQRVYHNEYKKSARELSDRYKCFYRQNENGNYEFRSVAYTWREGQTADDCLIGWDIPTYYDDLIDDTNMNLTWLLINKNTDLFEMATEWVNCHSEHLLKELTISKYEYVYDNNKNIIQINKINFFSNKIMETYKIYYQE